VRRGEGRDGVGGANGDSSGGSEEDRLPYVYVVAVGGRPVQTAVFCRPKRIGEGVESRQGSASLGTIEMGHDANGARDVTRRMERCSEGSRRDGGTAAAAAAAAAKFLERRPPPAGVAACAASGDVHFAGRSSTSPNQNDRAVATAGDTVRVSSKPA